MLLKSATALVLFAACAFGMKNGDSVPLWANGAPGSEGMAGKQELVIPAKPGDSTHLSQIHNPSLLVYLPPKDKATGAAMIIAPGGGHRFLSIDTEGTNVAEWLSSIGVAAFVLKYRLAHEECSPYKVEIHALADAQRSIRMVRARAAEWGVNPAKVGFIGFSAGGELAVLASTRYDAGNPEAADPIEKQSSRPDYQILIYPGVRADNVQFTKDTPPTFMLCASNDNGPQSALPVLYVALKKAGVSAEMHIFASGGHGFGLRPNEPRPNPIYHEWAGLLQHWMADVGMSPAKTMPERMAPTAAVK
jgi:endo-1,4-beta-xylanase